MSKPKNMTPEQESAWKQIQRDYSANRRSIPEIKAKILLASKKHYATHKRPPMTDKRPPRTDDMKKKRLEAYAKNPAKYRDQRKKWAEENREKHLQSKRNYHNRNREKCLENSRKWYEKNRERVNMQQREYRLAEPDKYRHEQQKRRDARRDRIREQQEARKLRKTEKEKEKDKERIKSWVKRNPEKRKVIANKYARNRTKETPGLDAMLSRERRKNLSAGYVATLMGAPFKVFRQHPELIEAKREQIKILRELKPTNRKQTQCTRIQATYQKSVTTSPKRLTPHGLTSLLSIELSSWSTPWVRQLTQLLLKSKPLR